MPPAATVDEYLAKVPAEHRDALARVRAVVAENLPAGFEEGILYNMISWYVPPERYGHTYNGQPLMFTALASQKNYMALYLTGAYGDPWFTSAFAAAGKKLDMGKSCVRFRRLDDLPLDVIAKVIARVPVDEHIANYERDQGSRKQKPVVIPGRAASSAKPSGAAPSKAKPAIAAAKKVATSKTKAKAKPVVAAKKATASKAKPAAAAKKASAKTKPPVAKKASAKKPSAKKPAAKKTPARKRK